MQNFFCCYQQPSAADNNKKNFANNNYDFETNIGYDNYGDYDIEPRVWHTAAVPYTCRIIFFAAVP